MEYYNDDFFNDYNEFDAQIEEFKESIKKGLKQEIKDIIKHLEEENKELKNKVRNLNELEQDLKRQIANTKNDYFNAKFGELIEKCFENEKLYTITTEIYYINNGETVIRNIGKIKNQSENVYDLIDWEKDIVRITWSDGKDFIIDCNINKSDFSDGYYSLDWITAIYKPDEKGNYIKVWEVKKNE